MKFTKRHASALVPVVVICVFKRKPRTTEPAEVRDLQTSMESEENSRERELSVESLPDVGDAIWGMMNLTLRRINDSCSFQ